MHAHIHAFPSSQRKSNSEMYNLNGFLGNNVSVCVGVCVCMCETNRNNR